MSDRRSRHFQPSQDVFPTTADIEQIIVQGDMRILVQCAERVGEHLAQIRLTTNQIRNVFGAVRQIEMNWDQNAQEAYRQAILLQPKMAYFGKRERGMDQLERALSPALTLVAQGEDAAAQKARFAHFAEFFEAILAYHKKHGGN
ncbi:MAG: type III-A CRISPR-associated protein Csm2 [Anaerolineae bacterium]|nr:type III-A CRISPR-associated protein Csm2 [Anaerolineae bacterium]